MCLALDLSDDVVSVAEALMELEGRQALTEPEPEMSEAEILLICDELAPAPRPVTAKSKLDQPLSRILLPRARSKAAAEPPVYPEIPKREQDQQDAIGSKALLVEIIKRAVYDWVLYRNSGRAPQRKLADGAYLWLFVEDAGHLRWQRRQANGKSITSFIAICEVFDLDPEILRRRFRMLTPNKVLSFGNMISKARDEIHDPEMKSYVDLPPEHDEFFDV